MKQFYIWKVLDYAVNIEVNVYKNTSSMKRGIIRGGFTYLPGTRAQVSPIVEESLVNEEWKVTKRRCVVF